VRGKGTFVRAVRLVRHEIFGHQAGRVEPRPAGRDTQSRIFELTTTSAVPAATNLISSDRARRSGRRCPGRQPQDAINHGRAATILVPMVVDQCRRLVERPRPSLPDDNGCGSVRGEGPSGQRRADLKAGASGICEYQLTLLPRLRQILGFTAARAWVERPIYPEGFNP
jgi:hypothetical protein